MKDVINPYVAVLLSPSEQPRVCKLTALAPEILLGGQVFSDSGAGDWLGFYDWLRTKSGEVIGVRLWVDDPNAQIQAASQSASVVASGNCFPMMIYFCELREFEAELSGDQDFGANMLLVSSNAFALTFNAPSWSSARWAHDAKHGA